MIASPRAQRFRSPFPAATSLACSLACLLTACGGGGTSSHTVGGTISGLPEGASVTLENSAGSTLTLNANGTFTFPARLASGSRYSVSVQSHTPAVRCVVDQGSGAIASADVASVSVSCGQGTFSVVQAFGNATTQGGQLVSELLLTQTGDLYGTACQGGAIGGGTVFKISASGVFSVVYAIGATANEGDCPRAGVSIDAAGNLYGTTNVGGANYRGTLFKIDTAGQFSVLHAFGDINVSGEGQDPQATPFVDSAGNVYGTTYDDNTGHNGSVYKVDAAGQYTQLYVFPSAGGEAANPKGGGLVMDASGNLWGTALFGGANGRGAVFKIDRTGAVQTAYSFLNDARDGLMPQGGLALDSAGNFYGATVNGGRNGTGTVFKLSPAGVETVIHDFANSPNAPRHPLGGVVVDSAGNLYGTTSFGGPHDTGTLFKISAAGVFSVLHAFGAPSDGDSPQARLVIDRMGNLYGTTSAGGPLGGGTVFKFD